MDPTGVAIETPRERWARRNFWLSVAALVLVEIILIGLVSAYPEMFPQRWGRAYIRVIGATHRYLVVQAAVFVAMELALAYFFYRQGGSTARWIAAGFGAWLLIHGVIVELLLATVHVPITTWHVMFLLYVAVSHLAYAVFASSERYGDRSHFWSASDDAWPPRGVAPSSSTFHSPGAAQSPRVLTPEARSAQVKAARMLERLRTERRAAEPRSKLLGRITIIGAIIGVMVGVLRAADDGVWAIPVSGILGAAVARGAGMLFIAALDRLSQR